MTPTQKFDPKRHGRLAYEANGECRDLAVLKNGAGGFYIGTVWDDGSPNTRESTRYWAKRPDAERALKTGNWSQKLQL